MSIIKKGSIALCTKCEKIKSIYNVKNILCRSCYDYIARTSKVYACIECGEVRTIRARGICNICYGNMQRKKRKENSITTVCSRCGIIKLQYNAELNLCHSCYSKHLRDDNGYKTPIRECTVCGEKTHTFAHNMCKSCYNKQYVKINHDAIERNRRFHFRKNPDRKRNYDRQWLKKKNNNKNISNTNMRGCVPLVVKSNQEIIDFIPEMKKIFVNEFLMTVYLNRKENTKRKFLLDINRLLEYVKNNIPEHFEGSWNILTVSDIEKCQIDTGILKDSLKVFFRWLRTRKEITLQLENAFIPCKRYQKTYKIPIENLKKYVEKFFNDETSLVTRIAGRFIIYYLCTPFELQKLKNSDVAYKKVNLHGNWYDIDEDLWNLIEEYNHYKQDYYFHYATDFFFMTGMSVSEQKSVSRYFFWRQFKCNGVGISPTELRKAMISFYKHEVGMDFFELSAISGISPVATIPY